MSCQRIQGVATLYVISMVLKRNAILCTSLRHERRTHSWSHRGWYIPLQSVKLGITRTEMYVRLASETVSRRRLETLQAATHVVVWWLCLMMNTQLVVTFFSKVLYLSFWLHDPKYAQSWAWKCTCCPMNVVSNADHTAYASYWNAFILVRLTCTFRMCWWIFSKQRDVWKMPSKLD